MFYFCENGLNVGEHLFVGEAYDAKAIALEECGAEGVVDVLLKGIMATATVMAMVMVTAMATVMVTAMAMVTEKKRRVIERK